MSKKVRISARINPELEKRIIERAAKENRQFSNMIETMLYEAEEARNNA